MNVTNTTAANQSGSPYARIEVAGEHVERQAAERARRS